MRRRIILIACLLGIGMVALRDKWPPVANATHQTNLNASNLTAGTLPNARLDSSSVTLSGNFFRFDASRIYFPDGSEQTTAAGSSQWATSGSSIYNTNSGSTTVTSSMTVRGAFTSTSTTNLASEERNVAIGTSAIPSSKLDVFGGSLTIRGADAGLQIGASNFIITARGDVIIGTAAANRVPLQITKPAGTSGVILQVSTGTKPLFEVNGASVNITSVPLYALSSPYEHHEVWFSSSGGVGSTNDDIKFFHPANQVISSGTAITIGGDSVVGSSFAINQTGYYSITYSDQFNGAVHMGISVNSTQLTTAIQSITKGHRRLVVISPGANVGGSVSGILFLQAGDVVRAHIDSAPAGSNVGGESFRIIKLPFLGGGVGP